MRDKATERELSERAGSSAAQGIENAASSGTWGSDAVPAARSESSRLAYADPPYPGRAHLYAEHPDYAGEVDHLELIKRLSKHDGWALSTNAESLWWLLPVCGEGVRVLAWIKHTVNVSWEPVIVKSARPVHNLRDWIRVEPESYQYRPRPDSYVIGQKPEAFCRWLFEWLGAKPGDEFQDLFPGSGAVGRAWARWSEQPSLLSPPSDRAQRRARKRMLAAHPTIEDAAWRPK